MSNSDSFGEYVSNAIISQRDGETLYSGTHQGTGREVVIRCFQKSAFDNDKVAERVEADARKSIERRHKNVLMCFDAGTCERGVYLVFEKLDKSNLLSVMETEGGHLDERRCFEILYDCAVALSCLEDNDVVHRKVRPHNIFVQGKGEAKLSDIDLTPRSSDYQHRIEDLIYMSPQQIAGNTRVDIRDDMYALGIMGITALAGKAPFQAETIEEMLALKEKKDPMEHCECSDKARAFFKNCCNKDRNKRYLSAEACSIAIEEVMYGNKRPETKKHTRPKSQLLSRAEDKKPSPLPIILILIAIVAFAATFALSSPLSQRDKKDVGAEKPNQLNQPNQLNPPGQSEQLSTPDIDSVPENK
ncbi:MAG: protein kinase [Planctomycetes bacterium]|nr:protein kinase [Planctomycetota bacterium]